MRRHYRCNFRLLSLNGHESAMRKTQRTHRYTQSQPLPPSHTLSMTNGGTTMRQIPTTGVGGRGQEKKKKNVTSKVMSYFLPLSPRSETLMNPLTSTIQFYMLRSKYEHMNYFSQLHLSKILLRNTDKRCEIPPRIRFLGIRQGAVLRINA